MPLDADQYQRLYAQSVDDPDAFWGDAAKRLDWMRAVDMAVVVSSSQNEIAHLEAKGLDIRQHRHRRVQRAGIPRK